MQVESFYKFYFSFISIHLHRSVSIIILYYLMTPIDQIREPRGGKGWHQPYSSPRDQALAGGPPPKSHRTSWCLWLQVKCVAGVWFYGYRFRSEYGQGCFFVFMNIVIIICVIVWSSSLLVLLASTVTDLQSKHAKHTWYFSFTPFINLL